MTRTSLTTLGLVSKKAPECCLAGGAVAMVCVFDNSSLSLLLQTDPELRYGPVMINVGFTARDNNPPVVNFRMRPLSVSEGRPVALFPNIDITDADVTDVTHTYIREAIVRLNGMQILRVQQASNMSCNFR